MKYFPLLFFLQIIIMTQLIISQDPSANLLTNETDNETQITSLLEPLISITKFFPKEVKLGDVDFNIQIQNNLNETLKNIAVFVSGKGFSTYEIITIEELVFNQRDYLFVKGNFKEPGTITLRIKINNEIFYQNVSVIDVENMKIEQTNKEILKNLSIELENLKKNYTNLELKRSEKKDDGYDVSGINLDELKNYIRNTESQIILEDVNNAKASLKLVYDEYNYQKEKLDNVKTISILTVIKENALLITTIISAILAIFAIAELLRKKGESTIHAVKKVMKKNES